MLYTFSKTCAWVYYGLMRYMDINIYIRCFSKVWPPSGGHYESGKCTPPARRFSAEHQPLKTNRRLAAIVFSRKEELLGRIDAIIGRIQGKSLVNQICYIKHESSRKNELNLNKSKGFGNIRLNGEETRQYLTYV